MSRSHKLPSKGRIAWSCAKVGTRFVTGRPLDGKRRTDAGFFRRGVEVKAESGHASRLAHLPYAKVAALRLGATATGTATTVGTLVDPVATWDTWQTGIWGVSAWGVYAVGEKAYRYSHFRQYVQPVADVVGPRVGWSKTTAARSWVDVPHGHREDPEKVVVLRFPKGFALTEAKKKELLGLARPILGLHGCDATWTPGGESGASVELRAAPAPPELVTFAKVRHLLEAAPWNEPVIGLAARSRPVTVSFAQDSPHLLCSFGSGGGKSTLQKALASHFRRRGGRVLIVDVVKRGASAKWAKEVEGIEVIRSPGRAHDVLLSLNEEVQDRCELAWTHGEIDRTPVLLIVEEANATQRLLQRHWIEERKERGDPTTSPAIAALADILCVGREALTHVVTFAQQGNAKATGGGDARENYGVRMLARFTRNTAKMLVPELAPAFPKSSKHPGRIQVVTGGEATETQVALFSDQEARDWALGGVAVGPVPGTLRADSPAHTPSGDAGTPGTRHLELVPPPVPPPVQAIPDDVEDWTELPPADPLVSLAEAADGMVVEASVGALKKARTRDREGFPPSRGRDGQTLLYRPAELRTYWDNRPGSGALASASSEGGSPR